MARAKPKFSIRAKRLKGWYVMQGLLKQAQAGQRLYAKVGIQAPEAEAPHEGGLTNAELMAVHEFGTEDIPARPVIRPTVEEGRYKYARMLTPLLRRVLKGEMTLRGALMLVGEAIRTDMIERVRKGLKPALAPETVAQKGGETTPLIDSGQLILQSIRATVADAAED